VLEMLPPPPAPGGPGADVPPSRQSLTGGFKSLRVTYFLGGLPHATRITDPKALAVIHKELAIVKEQPPKPVRPTFRRVQIEAKDGSRFDAYVVGETDLLERRAGRFTLRPGFFKALSREVSRLAGQPIDVLKENPITERQSQRAAEFRKLLAEAKAIRFPH